MKLNRLSRLLGFEVNKIDVERPDYMRLFNKYLYWPRLEQCTVILDNRKFIVPDGPSFAWQIKEIFSEECYRFNATTDSPLILDIGANIGTSVLWFKKNYPNANIIAFEADKNIFEILQKNTGDLDGVQLEHKAVWISDEILSFHADGADGGTLIGNGEQTKKVQGIRLRDFIKASSRKIDFLKMDIEGAESIVLPDCEDIFDKIENIFIEYHSFNTDEQSLGKILTILSKSGFRFYIQEVSKRKIPFVNKFNTKGTMDMQVEIYGYRVSDSF